MDFVVFSFLQGVMAFFAPCAVALLPGYIVAFITRNPAGPPPEVKQRLFRGLKLAFLSILGIFVIYLVAGILIVLASHLLRQYMKWVTIGMGSVLTLVGLFMVFGRSFSFTLHVNRVTPGTETTEAFLFGIAYAIGALGCLFPLFLVVATQAMAAPTALEGGSYILAYFAGISGMMIAVITLSTFAKNWVMAALRNVLPYMEQVTGGLLILAGIYVIYYQMVLF